MLCYQTHSLNKALQLRGIIVGGITILHHWLLYTELHSDRLATLTYMRVLQCIRGVMT